tara:strand:+ start:217 stop:1677 length:1461 start_codon:yes stop_codon:yes gene_type:complete
MAIKSVGDKIEKSNGVLDELNKKIKQLQGGKLVNLIDINFKKNTGKVINVVYKSEVKADSIQKIKAHLQKQFGVIGDIKKDTIKVGRVVRGKNVSFDVNFKKKKPVTGGKVINTEVQEKGTTVIFNQVLRKNKTFNKKEDIMADKDTLNKLKDVFKGYDDDRIEDWTHSYYEQQKEFLKKFKSDKWDEFRYDNQTFVKFFENHIKNKVVANNLKPLDLVKKYTEWNPADIWAVYQMDKVKEKIDKNITPKTSNVVELNNILINLFKERKLVGLSLKKIAPKQSANLKFVNITPSDMKIAKIEKYKMSDIDFVVDNIFQGDAIATTVKFDNGTYKIDIGHAGSRSAAGNLNFNTAIKATPGARGGQAPIAMILKLLKNKGGTGITFVNDHNKYPKSGEEFIEESSTFEDYYKVVKPYFKKTQNYSQFEKYIKNLYKSKKFIAQTKLMELHFFHDSLKNYSQNTEFWTDLLYLGLKVGGDFAPHAKIS